MTPLYEDFVYGNRTYAVLKIGKDNCAKNTIDESV